MSARSQRGRTMAIRGRGRPPSRIRIEEEDEDENTTEPLASSSNEPKQEPMQSDQLKQEPVLFEEPKKEPIQVDEPNMEQSDVDDEEDEEDEDHGVVETVLDVVARNNHLLYRVRWEGCAEAEDTFEPEENFFAEDSKKILDEFKENNKEKIEKLREELRIKRENSRRNRKANWVYESPPREKVDFRFPSGQDELAPREFDEDEEFYGQTAKDAPIEVKRLFDPTHKNTKTELILNKISGDIEGRATRSRVSKLAQEKLAPELVTASSSKASIKKSSELLGDSDVSRESSPVISFTESRRLMGMPKRAVKKKVSPKTKAAPKKKTPPKKRKEPKNDSDEEDEPDPDAELTPKKKISPKSKPKTSKVDEEEDQDEDAAPELEPEEANDDSDYEEPPHLEAETTEMEPEVKRGRGRPKGAMAVSRKILSKPPPKKKAASTTKSPSTKNKSKTDEPVIEARALPLMLAPVALTKITDNSHKLQRQRVGVKIMQPPRPSLSDPMVRPSLRLSEDGEGPQPVQSQPVQPPPMKVSKATADDAQETPAEKVIARSRPTLRVPLFNSEVENKGREMKTYIDYLKSRVKEKSNTDDVQRIKSLRTADITREMMHMVLNCELTRLRNVASNLEPADYAECRNAMQTHRTPGGGTILHELMRRRCDGLSHVVDDTIRFVLIACPDLVEVPDENGVLPIHCAVQNGQVCRVLRLLLDGSPLSDRNTNGDSAIDLAYRKNHGRMVDLLLSHGADYVPLRLAEQRKPNNLRASRAFPIIEKHVQLLEDLAMKARREVLGPVNELRVVSPLFCNSFHDGPNFRNEFFLNPSEDLRETPNRCFLVFVYVGCLKKNVCKKEFLNCWGKRFPLISEPMMNGKLLKAISMSKDTYVFAALPPPGKVVFEYSITTHDAEKGFDSVVCLNMIAAELPHRGNEARIERALQRKKQLRIEAVRQRPRPTTESPTQNSSSARLPTAAPASRVEQVPTARITGVPPPMMGVPPPPLGGPGYPHNQQYPPNGGYPQGPYPPGAYPPGNYQQGGYQQGYPPRGGYDQGYHQGGPYYPPPYQQGMPPPPPQQAPWMPVPPPPQQQQQQRRRRFDVGPDGAISQ